jgi:hypothetical protein
MPTIDQSIEYKAYGSPVDDLRFIWEDREFEIASVKRGVMESHVTTRLTSQSWLLTIEHKIGRETLQKNARRLDIPVKRLKRRSLDRMKRALRNLGLEITGRSEIQDGYYVIDGIRPSES